MAASTAHCTPGQTGIRSFKNNKTRNPDYVYMLSTNHSTLYSASTESFKSEIMIFFGQTLVMLQIYFTKDLVQVMGMFLYQADASL